MNLGKSNIESTLVLLPKNITNSSSLIIQDGLHGKYVECIKQCINKFSFIKSVKDFNYLTFLKCDEVENVLETEELLFELFIFSVSCLQVFIKQNWTGPFFHCSVSDTLWMNQIQQTDLLEKMEKDGEYVNENVVDIFLFAISLNIFEKINGSVDLPVVQWWYLRCLSIYQQLLSDRSPSLKKSCEKLIEKLFVDDNLEKMNNSLKVQLNLEVGLISIFNYDYEFANEHFLQANELSGIQCTLSGRMGIRTKFQKKPTSQLCLQIKKMHEINSTINTDPDVPQALLLNNETLLETVKFVDTGEDIPELCPEQQAVLLAYCTHMTKARPAQLLFNNFFCFLATASNNESNYSFIPHF